MATTQKSKTQTQRILSTLQSGKSITAAQAKTRGVMRLSARVHELRGSGFPVISVPYTNKAGMNAVKYVLSQPKPSKANRRTA